MNYEQAWNNQREVSLKLAVMLKRLQSAAKAVVAMECDRVNVCKNSEPYDPIANPGQFDERIVALAWALEREKPDEQLGRLGSVEPGEVTGGEEG